MISVAFCRLASSALALALLAAPATGQPYNQPYQPGFQPQGGGVPSIVGSWSGFSTGSAGTLQEAEAYSEDGRFVMVSRQPSGLIGRYWGFYRATPISPNQIHVETQLQGYLPQESCSQVPGNQPVCHPMQLNPNQAFDVTFSSPTQIATSNGVTVQRDAQPALLQAQAPQRWVTMIPSAAPAPGPGYNPGYTSGYSPRPITPYKNGCAADDGQRALCKYSGRLVTSGGCLRCVD